MQDIYNFATYLVNGCRESLDRTSLVVPEMVGGRLYREESTSFSALLNLARDYQVGLTRHGLLEGDRVIIVMPPSIDMYALIVACIASGVVPVFIDLGMSREKINQAMQDANAQAIFSISRLLKFWPFIPALRRIKRYTADTNVPLCKSIAELKFPCSDGELSIQHCGPETHCLITFTSGTTGRPKGADRTHGCLINQHLALKDSYSFDASVDVGLTCFPVAALHQFACGVTTVLPRVDMSRIAEINPVEVINQIRTHGVTFIGSAPAFLDKLTENMVRESSVGLAVKGIVIGGSTVADSLLVRTSQVFPNANIQVFYGSTESEPISHISAKEVIEANLSEGYLVGPPVNFCEVKIVNSLAYSICTPADVDMHEVDSGDVGEIFVSGEHVLKRYVDNDEATSETKIMRENGSVWHRTGDMACLDSQGRILLKGRDRDFIKYNNDLIANYPIEKKIDGIAGITRSALINTSNGIALCLSITDDRSRSELIRTCLDRCSPIDQKDITVFVLDNLPVDGRHNSKVDRPALRRRIEEGELIDSGLSKVQARDGNGEIAPTLVQEWLAPKRLISLMISLFCVGFIVNFYNLSFQETVGYFVNNIYIQAPVVFGGVLHMLVVTRDYLPRLKVPIYTPWFGKNKTWRGVIAVTFLTTIGALLVYPIELSTLSLFSVSLLHGVPIIVLGVAGGLGYVVGELPNSFIKRRLGAQPGEMPEKLTDAFIAFDQVDSAIGVAFMYWLVGIPAEACWMYLVTFPITALVVKRYLYIYKLKGMAR